MSMRYDVSERAAAAIATATLIDFNIVDIDNKSLVVDKNKITREKNKIVNDCASTSQASATIKGLYFDGRRDFTLKQIKEGKITIKRKPKEDHYSLLEEPGSKYITHITPTAGDAASICDSICDYFTSNTNDTLTNLAICGCDNTVLNTGVYRGILRCLEVKLQRPLQWSICLLHFNELPLRHLIETIDGRAYGPQGLTGPIGKKLYGCENFEIVRFAAIKVSHDLEITNPEKLSHDQKYLFDIFYAIKAGNCPEKLKNRSPGTINLSRWLTTANRILRYYMSESSPTNNLKLLVNYVMNVYVPFWFKVKKYHSIKDGARHIFSFIQLTRYLDKKYLKIIDPVISRNCYFAHPENVLLSMLSDSRRNVRVLAINKILQARGANNNTSVRTFSVPKLNFEATDYINMVNLEAANITNVSSCDLALSIDNEKWEFFDYPNHTQAVERTVKLVTEASSKVYGYENRNAYIKTTLESRKQLPLNNSKHHLQKFIDTISTD